MKKDGGPGREEIRDRVSEVWEDFPEVRFAYLFGSRAEGKAGPLSDVDIAVYLEPYTHSRFLELYAALSRALKLDHLDLLVLNRTHNLILLEEIIRHGLLLFERDPDLRMDFELETLHLALDFRERRKRIFGI
ncbi:nucleotidyltransferase domain-containing protein [Thermosulfurimonas sp. F29]|uniref:type VII toxin-antitoxin system MntA family adenylyltransferase antitoxin n=1 Tax=Thermosulfurimonas sp. F29 TaxID=2867247 RepID=UPI001C82B4F7|nr:nucleotidyltransferase domain-containing protein [Thermosulfurimonas sp. F29]MBX6422340.1 nucleotidyltransferase domain-containing protein [Thermosulfurimonas sp. F29]